jgi:diaminohydroxyphosphoribosylaminopyrimidine deaminase / 5-amino-6-(5-phosphoribosylamino)uracil reductase
LANPSEHERGGAAQDRRFMGVALALARRVLGTTAPNPAVGALIVDEASGEVTARGWTQPGGRPHAEAHVLLRAGAQAHGKTMYVTLEPCSHHGRTPPCADAIRAAGVRRLVCAIEDPNPEISGKGFASLRQAGIAVETGVCAEAARWMAAGHILRMTKGRPFVQLKLAVSADGLIAPGDGAPRWVSNEQARAYAHLLRARADAILIGSQTVADDDPQLTCRLPGLGNRSPRRYVLDSRLRTAPGSKLATSAGAVPVTLFGAPDAPVPALPASVVVRRIATDGNGLSLTAVLASLNADGITRLLVEGGPHVAGSFVAADLVDEAVIARGTETLAAAGVRPLAERGLEVFEDRERWLLHSDRSLGSNRMTIYRARRHLGARAGE